MADVTKEQYDALLQRVETAEAVAKEAAKKEMDILKESNLKLSEANEKSLAEIKKLNSELEASKELSKANEDNRVKLAEEIKTLEDALAKAKEDMSKCQKEMSKNKRKSSMASLDIPETEQDRLVEKFIDVSDEFFDELVKAMPKKMARTEENTTASLKETLETAENKDTNVIITEEATNLLATAKAWFADTLSKENKGE